MIIRHRKHSIPLLNTVATADISFMLLIFFLVTTSMDTDKGLQRRLPADADNVEQEAMPVERKNIIELQLMPDGALTVDGKVTPVDSLRDIISAFISKIGHDHVVAFDVSNDAEYGKYFRVQNQLVNAYKDVREDIAMREYGKHLTDLSTTEREDVYGLCPLRISEDSSSKGENVGGDGK